MELGVSAGCFLGKLETTPPALNLASMVGHGTIRHLAMDPKNQIREATPEEIAKMKKLLAEELKAGPFGLRQGWNMIRGIL